MKREMGSLFSFCICGFPVWDTHSLGGHKMGYKLFCLQSGASSVVDVLGGGGKFDSYDGSHSNGSV